MRLTNKQVICPVASIPIMIGIGLNYKVHAEEANVRNSYLSVTPQTDEQL